MKTCAKTLQAKWLIGSLCSLGLAFAAAPATAGLVVSPLILDIAADQPPRGDVELLNDGAERLYVVVAPAEVLDAGKPTERRTADPDPDALGLLAAPNRLVLEPGQRKFLRLAVLKPPGAEDRIYRVTVKPVVGGIAGAATGLKVLVGYEMLVIQRPEHPSAHLSAERRGAAIVVTNSGDTNAELFHGRQCDGGGATCTDLPSYRVYPGASVEIPVKSGFQAHYTEKVRDSITDTVF